MKRKIIYSLLIFSTIVCQSTVFANKTQDFFKAVESNKLKEVQKLAPEIKNINATNKDGITAVHLACLKGHLEIVKYLASNKKVDFDMKTKWGTQHIHFAAQKGNLEIFNYLITTKKDDIHLKDMKDRTPLWFALSNKQFNIALTILEKSTNQNFNIPDKTYNRTPLWFALFYKQYKIAKIILEKSTNQNFNIPNKTDNTTPLWLALNNKQFDIALTILEKSTNKNFNIPDNRNNITPLWLALNNEQYKIALTILEKSTDQNFNIPHKKYNTTPLWIALNNKQYKIAESILEKSTDKNFNTPDKKYHATPLWIALYSKQYKIAKIILEKSTNQNFNIPYKQDNTTPLWLALYNEQFDITKIILEKSIDKNFNVPDKSGKTPLWLTCSLNDDQPNKLKETFNLLIEKGAAVNQANLMGETPIMKIITNMRIDSSFGAGNIKGDLCEKSIKNGADIYKKNNSGENAFEIAKEYNKQHGAYYYTTPLHTHILALHNRKIKIDDILKNVEKRKKPLSLKAYKDDYLKEKKCYICLEKKDKKNMIAFHPCGHLQCIKCFKTAFRDTCPFCRKEIEEIEYLSKLK